MTYAEMAAHYGVSLDHLDWQERRVTKSGLRRFLIEVWWRKQTRYFEDWEGVWQSNLFAYHEAMTVWHRRLPKHLFDADRTRVAWYLGRSMTPLDSQRARLRSKAWTWASRRNP